MGKTTVNITTYTNFGFNFGLNTKSGSRVILYFKKTE